MAFRSLIGFVRAAERVSRDNYRRRRARERAQEKARVARLKELERRNLRVQRLDAEENNEKLNQLFSFHLAKTSTIDWKEIYSLNCPTMPSNDHKFENMARADLQNFSPSNFDRLFNKTGKKLQQLRDRVRMAVEKDNHLFQQAMQEHTRRVRDWQEWHDLAGRVIDLDINSMILALQKLRPYALLEGYCKDFHVYAIGRRKIKASFCTRSKHVIPTEKQKILKSGRVSITPFSENQLNKMYKEHVCSLALRVLIDILSSIPIEEVLLVVNVREQYDDCNVAAEIPIFILEGKRESLKLIDPLSVNAPDNLWIFTHMMNYTAKSGFNQIKPKQKNIFIDLKDKSSFQFYCNGCGIRYTATPQLEGKSAKCKQCGQLITVPKIE